MRDTAELFQSNKNSAIDVSRRSQNRHYNSLIPSASNHLKMKIQGSAVYQDRKSSWTELNELNWTNWTDALSPCSKLKWTNWQPIRSGRQTELNELFVNNFELKLRPSDTTPRPGQANKHSQQSTSYSNQVTNSGPMGWDFRWRGPRTAPLLLPNSWRLYGLNRAWAEPSRPDLSLVREPKEKFLWEKNDTVLLFISLGTGLALKI